MPQSKIIVTPSILACNLSKLQDEVDSVASADWLQIDVMDGHFVPNLTFGAPLLKDLKTKLLLDIHLMVSNPAERIQEFVEVGAHNITFHAEAVPDTNDQRTLIETIHKAGCTAGIALNPDTPFSVIKGLISSDSSVSSTFAPSGASPFAKASTFALRATADKSGDRPADRSDSSVSSDPDLILCMTVHPGFSGQGFISDVLQKIAEIRRHHPDVMIQVDGGIDVRTGKLCREAGATNLVAASYIFGSKDRKRAIESLRETDV